MAVLTVKEMMDEGSRWAKDEGKARRYGRAYLVTCSDRTDGPATVLSATGIPRKNDLHPTDPTAWVRTIDVDQHGNSGLLFVVRVAYSSPIFDGWAQGDDADGDGVPDDANPLLRPANYAWGIAARQVPMTTAKHHGYVQLLNDGTLDYSLAKDADDTSVVDTAVITSALEPYAPPPLRDIIDLTLTISRNEAGVVGSAIASVVNCINVDEFLGFAPGQALLKDIKAESRAETWRDKDDVPHLLRYWEVVYQIHFRVDGWWYDLADEGTLSLEPMTPGQNRKQIPIVDDETGLLRQTPTRLDGAGAVLDLKDPIAFPQEPAALFHRYRPYRLINFSTLGLI